MLVKAAIVCVEGVRKKIQGAKLADALPYRIHFKGSSSGPGSAEEPLAHAASLMQHLGNWWTRAGHQLLLPFLIIAVRDVLLDRWGSSFLGRKAESWQLHCHLLLQPSRDVEWEEAQMSLLLLLLRLTEQSAGCGHVYISLESLLPLGTHIRSRILMCRVPHLIHGGWEHSLPLWSQ